MKSKLVVFLTLVAACEKHDDTPSTIATATASATETASVVASASTTPLAPIDPIASASAAPSVAARDGGATIDDKRRAALAKQAEDMQMQMLKALMDGGIESVLTRSDVPAVDLSQAYNPHDAGRGGGDLRMGTGGGAAIKPGGSGGLSGIGPRDH